MRALYSVEAHERESTRGVDAARVDDRGELSLYSAELRAVSSQSFMANPRVVLLAALAAGSVSLARCAVYDPLILPRPRDASADVRAAPDAGIDAAVEGGADAMGPDAIVEAGIDAARDAAADVRSDAADGAVDARADGMVPDGGCAAGQTDCGGTCVDLATSTMHCGECFSACPAVFNGAPRCRMGACVPQCTAPATAYDERGCVNAPTDACPSAMAPLSWVVPNVPHVRFDNLALTATNNVTLGAPCAAITGVDQVFTFAAQLPATFRAELFSESFDGAVAIRNAPCATTPTSETCANNTTRAGRELASSSATVAATNPVYVIAKAGTSSRGPYAIAVTATSVCTNRAINGGETCDDGNIVNGDGCDTTCGFTAFTGTSCAPPVTRYEAIRANLGTQRYRVAPPVVADSHSLTCGTAGTRDFVTFVTPATSGRLEIRGGGNESVALFAAGDCSVRPRACAGLGVSSATMVTAGTTYALVVESPLRPLEFSLTLSRCGDGVIGGNEECDDGNVAAGDGCSAGCNREASCEFNSVATNTFASPSRPRFGNCAVVPFTMSVGAAAVSHAVLVPLQAGDRVTATVSRVGGGPLNPWGIEILPESAAPMASTTAACNSTAAFACSNDAGASANSVTWVSPNPMGGNYFVRFFSQGVAGAMLNATVTVERYPRL